MQPNAPLVDDDSINELNQLLLLIKTQKEYSRDEQLALELGYNEGYFSQVRSRGKAPKKLLDTLRLYSESLPNAKLGKHSPNELYATDMQDTRGVINQLTQSNGHLSKSIYNYSEAARMQAEAAKLQAENTAAIVEQNRQLMQILTSRLAMIDDDPLMPPPPGTPGFGIKKQAPEKSGA